MTLGCCLARRVNVCFGCGRSAIDHERQLSTKTVHWQTPKADDQPNVLRWSAKYLGKPAPEHHRCVAVRLPDLLSGGIGTSTLPGDHHQQSSQKHHETGRALSPVKGATAGASQAKSMSPLDFVQADDAGTWRNATGPGSTTERLGHSEPLRPLPALVGNQQ